LLIGLKRNTNWESGWRVNGVEVKGSEKASIVGPDIFGWSGWRAVAYPLVSAVLHHLLYILPDALTAAWILQKRHVHPLFEHLGRYAGNTLGRRRTGRGAFLGRFFAALARPLFGNRLDSALGRRLGSLFAGGGGLAIRPCLVRAGLVIVLLAIFPFALTTL
jgi:hypothetical protein